MKKTINLLVKSVLLTVVSVTSGIAQTDTLHLEFGATQTVPDAAIENKIVEWGKTLKGQRVDVDVVAYYHKSDFKQYADKRVEEMFLSLNRKVRNLVTIKSQGSKKGKDFQRTRVDIIYKRPYGGNSTVSAEKSNGNASKTGTGSGSSNASQGSTTAKSESQPRPKSDTVWVNGVPTVEKKKPVKGKKVEEKPNDNFIYDTVWVNGKPKIEKRKKK